LLVHSIFGSLYELFFFSNQQPSEMLYHVLEMVDHSVGMYVPLTRDYCLLGAILDYSLAIMLCIRLVPKF